MVNNQSDGSRDQNSFRTLMTFNEKLFLNHSWSHEGSDRMKVATELDAGKMIEPLFLSRICLTTAADTIRVSIMGWPKESPASVRFRIRGVRTYCGLTILECRKRVRSGNQGTWQNRNYCTLSEPESPHTNA